MWRTELTRRKSKYNTVLHLLCLQMFYWTFIRTTLSKIQEYTHGVWTNYDPQEKIIWNKGACWKYKEIESWFRFIFLVLNILEHVRQTEHVQGNNVSHIRETLDDEELVYIWMTNDKQIFYESRWRPWQIILKSKRSVSRTIEEGEILERLLTQESFRR